MAQYVYSMHRVSKVVPPKREILKDISLSFFPGAKIGVLGLNGAGKSTLLRIMAGVDTEIDGEARPMPGIKVGYLPQEPQLDPSKTVRDIVEEAVGEIKQAQARLDEVYAAYAEPDADFDALAAEQAKLEAILQASDGHNLERQLEVAADALAQLCSDDVTTPVRLHVAAKRYLGAIEPAYLDTLSPASVQSLELQGGVFTPAQADAFATQSHALAAVRLRRYDDLAKVVGLPTPTLGHYMQMAERCLRAG